jgi:uncharacterized protein (DUF433 family)
MLEFIRRAENFRVSSKGIHQSDWAKIAKTMNAEISLSEAEQAIANLSASDKAQLLRWLEKEVKNNFAGIEKTDGVMNGAACIRQTRIPVWMLEQARRLGTSEVDLLRNYPQLSAQDLANAWDYVNAHLAEIEEAIAANESDD